MRFRVSGLGMRDVRNDSISGYPKVCFGTRAAGLAVSSHSSARDCFETVSSDFPPFSDHTRTNLFGPDGRPRVDGLKECVLSGDQASRRHHRHHVLLSHRLAEMGEGREQKRSKSVENGCACVYLSTCLCWEWIAPLLTQHRSANLLGDADEISGQGPLKKTNLVRIPTTHIDLAGRGACARQW
jgi:hypothetical protein